MSSVTIYTKPGCSNCDKTKELFNKLGVDYNVVDVSVDKAALKELRALKFRELPVVVTETDKWSGYDESKINKLANPESAVEPDDDTWDF